MFWIVEKLSCKNRIGLKNVHEKVQNGLTQKIARQLLDLELTFYSMSILIESIAVLNLY